MNGLETPPNSAWAPSTPARASDEAAEAFLLRRAAQHPPLTLDASGGLPDPTALAVAEAALQAADQAEAAALARTPFAEVWSMYESGDLTQPTFLAYCAEARKHRGFAHPWGYQSGAPDWTRAPCCVWEAIVCGMSPNDLRAIEQRGDLRDDVLADYQQVWRRVAPRFSDTWAEHETTPLRPRAAEALALWANPVRRAPIDRSTAAAFETRRWAASNARR